MRHMQFVIGIGAAVFALASAVAQTPGTAFTYQGRLETSGAPANGLHDLRFRAWLHENDPNNPIGPAVCKDNVNVSEGLFTTQLDFGSNVFAGFPLWLEVAVRADATPGNCGSGVYETLSPRQPLTPAPYAIYAANAGAAGLRIPYSAEASVAGGALLDLENTRTAGNAYAGIFRVRSAVDDSRAITGIASAGSGTTYGVWGESLSTAGVGVKGECFGGVGVLGESTITSGAGVGAQGSADSTSGTGVLGLAVAASGTNFGVRGQTNSPTGYAGYFTGGRNYFSGNVGIGISAPRQQMSLGANLDLYSGGSNSPTRPSIRGSAADNLVLNASSAGAVYFNFDGGTGGVRFHDGTSGGEVMRIDNDGDVGIGTTAPTSKLTVFGNAGANAVSVTQNNSTGGCAQFTVQNASNSLDALRGVHFGGGKGIYGQSDSGIGVHGEATASSGITYGVYGNAASPDGRGVYGVAAFSPSTNTSYGMLGEELPGPNFGWAIFAIGHVGATGSKSFRIDHPDDPENKYLLHYCPESPEIINFYTGKVMLDAAGEAVVQLPGYFAKINKDPRYTLTAIGAAMPNLHVADEISEEALQTGELAGPDVAAPLCSFRIAGGSPGAKVSWEVKALRNDLWVRHHGAPVEADKQGPEKGTYQHPELYGQPPEKGMNYDATRRIAPGASGGAE